MTATTVTTKINDDLNAQIERMAGERQRPADEVMGAAISEYVEREAKREASRQEKLTAWEAFTTTGHYVTADEADAWMRQLEQGHDIEPPPGKRPHKHGGARTTPEK